MGFVDEKWMYSKKPEDRNLKDKLPLRAFIMFMRLGRCREFSIDADPSVCKQQFKNILVCGKSTMLKVWLGEENIV